MPDRWRGVLGGFHCAEESQTRTSDSEPGSLPLQRTSRRSLTGGIVLQALSHHNLYHYPRRTPPGHYHTTTLTTVVLDESHTCMSSALSPRHHYLRVLLPATSVGRVHSSAKDLPRSLFHHITALQFSKINLGGHCFAYRKLHREHISSIFVYNSIIF